MQRNKSSSTMKNHGSMVLQKLNNSFLETILEVTEYLGLTYRVLKKKISRRDSAGYKKTQKSSSKQSGIKLVNKVNTLPKRLKL